MQDWLEGVSVRYEAPVERARPGTVYVGTEPPSSAAGLNELPGGFALVLTPKDVPQRSTACFAAHAVGLEAWRAKLHFAADGKRPLAGVTIVVEDASPDTCLAVVTLARRLAGLSVDAAWLAYSARWERGDTTSTGAPEASWGALHNALVHGLIDPATRDKANLLTAALISGCQLAEGLISLGAKPEAVPAVGLLPSPVSELVSGARAALALSRDVARVVAATSEVVQLAIPIRVLPHRRRTVDAVIVVDRNIVDVKVHLRRDPISPSGEGFAFLALYRPSEQGTGNDITFSVDPELGVYLQDLWSELERLEWQAWEEAGEARPRCPPRRLASFEPRGGQPPVSDRPSAQPWYDEHGRYTLIAAPRALPDSQPGSKISWERALGAVWRLYAPINALGLRSRDGGGAVDFFEGDEGSTDARARSPVCRSLWVSHLSRPPNLADVAWSETIARTCAAFLTSGRTSIDRLPSPDDFDIVVGRGGYVLASAAGVMTIEIAADAGFPLEELDAAIGRAAATLQAAMNLEGRVAAARRSSAEAIRGSKARVEALATLQGVLVEALQGAGPAPARSADPFVAQVEAALEKRWRPTERFRAVVEEAGKVRDMVVGASDVRANEIIGAVAIYGFPFALLVNLFAFALAAEHDNVLRGWTMGGLEVWPLLAWVGASAALALLLRLLVVWRGRAWRERPLPEAHFSDVSATTSDPLPNCDRTARPVRRVPR